ncbi:uncharacterized protein LOC136085643 [Hydra vulgaris]|uniref:Uncharacterized protein LOC136085643 n=1 Tax=Hydra vulgaris TaxID=6087 RepID=A0ABM4CMJ6_HYDVU
MPSSLDALSKNLAKDQFNETQLPPKESFFSILNDEDISDDDYSHAQNVWIEFNCKTFGDYHDLHNVSDVLLLADVFENFRDVCMSCYNLDPAWYYKSPELAWDAALKKKKKIELQSDYDMILMIKKGIRGGIGMISNRLRTSNKQYMGDEYDQSKPSTFIQYLDANNLYGWALSKPLNMVDLEYPEHLRDEHNDYPLALERLNIDKVEKLVPNLNNKKKGIKFEERAWLNEYIELNTNLRTKATNDFEKDFFKIMNDSVFGKTMENVENRVDIRLVTDRNEANKLASKPNFESRTIFDENLIAIHMKRTKLLYDKPIYLGMCILDLSKTLMYKFHYDYIKKKYVDRAKLLFTDTDYLAYEIITEDFYADISKDVENKFDTSKFNPKHTAINKVGFIVGVNIKVIGMFKDESGGAQIEEFVGLRLKLYSYKVHGKDYKKCKGVKKNVVKKYITHGDYKDCLLNKRDHIRKINVIRSYSHEIYTEEH